MDRRSFLTALFGVAGAAALATTVRPLEAVAGVPNVGNGILDELDKQDPSAFDDDEGPGDVEQIYHRRWHYRRYHRRRVWRRHCRRFWRYGRWHRRCYRRRSFVILRF
ncbi:twin-arginine translocation signal domain-containing protein [Mesorhizobium sp. WSM4303]|nr:twin-arginine translocation signal domain-containing protein [Mesorhizobium sp. WSM4306]TRD01011.1 twin-arginine translocation signal domain-containing protein [Mesorhizobium sp. WSM4303]